MNDKEYNKQFMQALEYANKNPKGPIYVNNSKPSFLQRIKAWLQRRDATTWILTATMAWIVLHELNIL